MTRHHVVILTGGALPGQDTPEPRSHDLNAAVGPAMHDALARLAELGLGDDVQAQIAAGTLIGGLVTAAWQAGHRTATRDHRVVAAFVLDDAGDAGRFAKFLAGEVDPAYVTAASDPADELLRHWENCAGRTVG